MTKSSSFPARRQSPLSFSSEEFAGKEQEENPLRNVKSIYFRASIILEAAVFLLMTLAIISPVYAIDNTVLDAFDAELEAPPVVDEVIVVEGAMVGWVRGMLLTGNGLAVLEGIEDGYLQFDGSGDSATGKATLVWDGAGEGGPDGIEYEGLGVNLSVDDLDNPLGALLFQLNSVTADGVITITIFSDDSNSSQYTVNPGVSVTPLDLIIPYGDFTNNGGSGADFANVGAIMIELSGGLVAELDQLEVIPLLGDTVKTDVLQVDSNSNGLVDPGDTIRYSVEITIAAAVDIVFSDTVDANTTLVAGSVITSLGTVTTGNTAGDGSVLVDVSPTAGGVVTISFDVVVNDPFPGGSSSVCNQGTISGTGLVSVQTDDPAVDFASPDPTCTAIFLDTVAPVLTVPADTSVNAGDSTEPGNTGGFATATDNVTASPVVTHFDTTVLGPLPFEKKIERTWRAVDEAGNIAQTIQTITITDSLSRALSVDEDVYGLFEPLATPGHRQLGEIALNGTIGLLGSTSSIDAGPINTAAGMTAYNGSDELVYFIGETTADTLSKIFTIDVSTGIGTAQPLSFGTASSVVGIWYDDDADVLYGLFQSGALLTDRQLTTINPTTGSVTPVGGGIAAPIYTVGGLVAGSSSQAEFYFLGSSGGIPGSIYRFDTSTGAATSVGLSGANYNAIASLEYDQLEDKLYALVFVGSERQLATIDPATGVVATIGSSTIAGGGVTIGTYSGVSTLDPLSNQFLFVGWYNGGSGNVWALFGVDTASGNSTYNNIDASLIKSGGYHGLEYDVSIGRLEVVNELLPAADPGLFNLQIDGVSSGSGTDAGDDGTTGEQALNAGTYQVGETAGSGTDLSNYSTSIECRDIDGAGSVVASGNGVGPLSVVVATDDDIVCVITNTHVHSLKDAVAALQVLVGISPSTIELSQLYDVIEGGKVTLGSVIAVLKELAE